MENIFVLLYRFFKKRRLVFWCFLLLATAIPAMLASRIRLEEDITSIIPRDEKTKALNDIFQQSKLLDKMILTVSMRDSTSVSPDSLVAFSDELSAAADSKLKPFIAGITSEIRDEEAIDLLDTLYEHLPVFLEERDYATMDSLISEQGVKTNLEKNFRILTAPAGMALKRFIAKDPSGIANQALKKLQDLQLDKQFEVYDGHILSKDQKKAILFIQPAYSKNNTGKNARFLEGLDHLIDSLQIQHPTIEAGYYGGTAVAVANALQLRRDTLLTQGITLFFLIAFLALYFRKASAPALVLFPALFGALVSLAIISMMKGSISVIALGTGSVILGIAVNYSLHVLNHFRHEPDMESVLRDLRHPMTIGSLTTIGGFLCLQWAESSLLRDLGLFGAFSLMGASLFSLVFLPQLIRPGRNAKTRSHSPIDRLAISGFSPSKRNFLIVLGLTVFFAFFVHKVRFEPNMSSLNYLPENLKKREAEMNRLNAYALQSLYLVSSAQNLEQALRQNEQAVEKLQELMARGIVKNYAGPSALLISDSLQKIRIARWNTYWTPEKKAALLARLQNAGAQTGFSERAFMPVQEMLNRQFFPVGDTVILRLAGTMLNNYLIPEARGVKVLTLAKTSPDQKAGVYAAFPGKSRTLLLDMNYVTARLVAMVQRDFNRISWMAAAMVFGVLLVSFGRIELTLIAFIPMLLTWIWILGIMGLAGIPFNIVNIIISALIFGLGDDYSLFTLDGLLQEYKTGRKNTSSFRSSIILSAITTVAGLGVLIFAKHPSLKSIALIAITGILCVVVISQIVIPFLFRLLITNRTRRGRQPFTAWTILTSVFAFLYFTFGAFLLSFIALVLLKLNPWAGQKVKYLYHSILQRFARSLMYIMANVRKTVLNPAGETLASPAVIISNHQSFLDILSIIMLHPKIVLVTNDWVWNSPVFGFVVRMADYFPVSKGTENNLGHLSGLFQQGYSIAVFPEGTRSPDGKMKRFHKGAFFLAQELGADIVPILLHGTGHTMGKGDFLLKDGHVIVEILPRITVSDSRFGEGYAERTKKISHYFKESHQNRKKQYEQGSWFRDRLLANYIFKGPTLEWYMRVKTKLEKNYRPFIELVPEKASVLDIGCGYGAMSYMLHFTGPKRDITGIDYDEEKIATAQHCFSKTSSIRFLAVDVLQFPFEHYDTILVCDILHYLMPDRQEQVLRKCMDHILPGGKLIVREGDSDLAEKHEKTKLTEFFSTRITRFNKTETGNLHFLSGTWLRTLAANNGFECREIKDSNLTSNIIFILERKGNHGE